jgi:hypothetical protein
MKWGAKVNYRFRQRPMIIIALVIINVRALLETGSFVPKLTWIQIFPLFPSFISFTFSLFSTLAPDRASVKIRQRPGALATIDRNLFFLSSILQMYFFDSIIDFFILMKGKQSKNLSAPNCPAEILPGSSKIFTRVIYLP